MVEAVQERDTVAREIRTAARHSAVYRLGAMAVKAIGFFMEILDLSRCLSWEYFSTWG